MANKLCAEVNVSCEHPVSSKMVRTELLRVGYYSRVAMHKPLITPGNAHLRVHWCKEHRQWTAEHWRNVIWSDESSFTMFSTNGCVHMW